MCLDFEKNHCLFARLQKRCTFWYVEPLKCPSVIAATGIIFVGSVHVAPRKLGTYILSPNFILLCLSILLSRL